MKLIIAEKPSFAKVLSEIIGGCEKKDGYFESTEYLITWCYGHLVSLAMPNGYDEKYAKWSLEDLPIIPTAFQTVINLSSSKQFYVIKNLLESSRVQSVICATDAGREGELIFRLVYDKVNCKKPFKRLWVSSNEEKAVKSGFENLLDGKVKENLYKSAYSRMIADWLIGINLSRYYSVMYNEKLNTGRVQTPVVSLIVERQREIENFVSQPYYIIKISFGTWYAVSRIDDFKIAQECYDDISTSHEKVAFVSKVDNVKHVINPPKLYKMSDLQIEANNQYGYTANETLIMAQKLYEKGFITYPRTSSTSISTDMIDSTQEILQNALDCRIGSEYTSKVDMSLFKIKRLVNNSDIIDHHGLLPTKLFFSNEKNVMQEDEHNLINLIIIRLLKASYVAYEYSKKSVVLEVESTTKAMSYGFTATSNETIVQGFKVFDNFDIVDEKEVNIIPQMAEGNTFTILKTEKSKKFTQPLSPYTESELIKTMVNVSRKIHDIKMKEILSNNGIGTEATRASIIENIISNNYVVRIRNRFYPTEKANTFIDLVHSDIKSVEMTAEWELKLEEVEKGTLDDKEFISDIITFLKTFISDNLLLTNDEDTIKNRQIFNTEPISIGICPKCNKKIFDYQKAYSCESGKDGCGFVIFKTIAKKLITVKQAQQLITNNKTNKISGFKSKKGNKFSAFLKLDENKKVIFEF